MENKKLKISEIKGRFLQFVETQNISVYKFSTESGISKSNFSGKSLQSELGGGQISEILTYFPDLSPDWLLLGKGEMLREKCENVGGEGRGFVKIPTDVWETMQMQTASLKAKDEQISRLIEMLSGNRGNSEGAGQGKKDRHAEEAGGRL